MAITILPREVTGGERIGEAFGQGLQTGLTGLLNQLAQQRAMEMSAMRTGRGLEALLGLSPEQAQAAGYVPESILKEFAKQKLIQPREQAYASALQSLLGSGEQAQPAQITGLTSQQATKLAELSFAKQKQEQQQEKQKQVLNLAQQKQVQARNKPYLEQLRKGTESAAKIRDIAVDMKTLFDTGKVASGLKGKLPTVLQNEESQQFDSKSNELATLLAGQSGVATNFKIKTAQASKPNLSQKPEAQKRLLEDIIEKSNNALLYDKVKNKIIDENGGIEPSNIESLIKKEVHKESKKEKKSSIKVGSVLDELPDASLYKGAQIQDEGTGQVYVSNGKSWLKKG